MWTVFEVFIEFITTLSALRFGFLAALEGEVLTTGPPGKSQILYYSFKNITSMFFIFAFSG